MIEPQGPWTEWTDAELEGSLADRFERQVARVPDRPALRSRTEGLTYASLDRRVNRIAHAALALREDRPEPMAILVKDGAAAITAILAAYKAAKISLHLDPTLPPERLRLLLEDSGAGLVASAGALLPVARTLASDAGIPLLDLGPGVFVLKIEARSSLGAAPIVSRELPFRVR
jgi:non-ribosomal peptide synthetase component F